jgi:hypothetical protein
VHWKALPEYDPTKLDSTQNSIPTTSGDFPKLNTHNAILITTARI